jgi:hypothetical protein
MHCNSVAGLFGERYSIECPLNMDIIRSTVSYIRPRFAKHIVSISFGREKWHYRNENWLNEGQTESFLVRVASLVALVD